MSDTMLHAVLRMPPSLWDDGAIDQAQRHARYLEASQRIEDCERDNEVLAHQLLDITAERDELIADILRCHDDKMDALAACKLKDEAFARMRAELNASVKRELALIKKVNATPILDPKGIPE